MRASRQERGFALVGAIFALVIIASLIAGAFFAARQELNIGRSTQTGQRAFDAAEAGMATRVATWAGGTLNALAVGDSAPPFTDTLPSNNGTVTSVVRRLNSQLFLIRAVGSSGTSNRMLGQIVKLQVISMGFSASLTTRASLTVGGSSFIDGRDTDPSNWGCPSRAADTVAAVRTPDSTRITTQGCNNYSCLFGTPRIQQDTTVRDSTFTQFGGLNYNDLAAMANIVYNGNTGPLNQIAPVGTATTCTTSITNNWGEPYRGTGTIAGCYGYFPIIHVAGSFPNGVYQNGTGDLSLTGGHGQGILLVDGDLKVDGGFEFDGPVITLGHFTTQGTGGHFTGGVMAADVDLELNTVLGNAVITYSSCSIARAINGSASGRVVRHRSWVDLTQ